jgi:hypothetical protein
VKNKGSLKLKIMKTFRIFSIVFLMGLLLASCEKESLEPVQDLSDQNTEFTVPDIPEDIAALMSDEDIALFKAGPGEIYLEESTLKSTRRKCGRWHPVLMMLEYELQIWPINSCDTWTDVPDFVAPVAVAGVTEAVGNWFFQHVESMYFPVFCFATGHAGHGQGFYELPKGKLFLEGENTPFEYDDDGNATFRRYDRFVGAHSGIFEGARGWEIMISYTAEENNPGNSPTGQGLSQTIAFGWVYY